MDFDRPQCVDRVLAVAAAGLVVDVFEQAPDPAQLPYHHRVRLGQDAAPEQTPPGILGQTEAGVVDVLEQAFLLGRGEANRYQLVQWLCALSQKGHGLVLSCVSGCVALTARSAAPSGPGQGAGPLQECLEGLDERSAAPIVQGFQT